MENIAETQLNTQRNGDVARVKVLDPKTMSGDEMNSLWQKLSKQDYAFDDNTRGDPRAFVLTLTDPSARHFLVGDSIYIVVKNVFLGSDCAIHLVVFDKSFPLHKVIEGGRQILEWLFKEQGVHRVTGFVPKFNPLGSRIATTMGFKYEGTVRKSVKWFDEYYDIDIYGILAKEFERRFQQ